MNKRISLVALLATLGLILIVLAPGCSQSPATSTPPTSAATVTATAAPTTVTKEVNKTYKVLNPNGTFIPIQTKPLAPRLSSIKGKTIYFTESEANPRIMPALLKRLQADYPDTTWHYTATASFGDAVPSDDMLKNAQGYIRGIAW